MSEKLRQDFLLTENDDLYTTAFTVKNSEVVNTGIMLSTL